MSPNICPLCLYKLTAKRCAACFEDAVKYDEFLRRLDQGVLRFRMLHIRFVNSDTPDDIVMREWLTRAESVLADAPTIDTETYIELLTETSENFFSGTRLNFCDCFFSNGFNETIEDFARDNDCTVTFTERTAEWFLQNSSDDYTRLYHLFLNPIVRDKLKAHHESFRS